MIREEAIKQLSDAEHCLAGHGDLWDVDMEAFDMAIKALEQDSILDKIKAEIKEWYWQADKQALAKDPCVVDAMIDLFIRTIAKHQKSNG